MKTEIFKGIETIVLESDELSVRVIPKLGGKISSIFYKPTEAEMLFQNKQDIYEIPKCGSDFSKFDASGFDDAFPNIDKEKFFLNDREVDYPDHGEVWTMPLSYTEIKDGISLLGYGKVLPYKFKKTISIKCDEVNLAYTIENIGDYEFPCFWTMHCLLNCTEDMEIFFPPETETVMVVQDSERLGTAKTLHSYPLTKTMKGESYFLNRVQSKKSKTMEKYYVKGKIKNGVCGVYYPKSETRIWFRYDANALPYLGFWVTCGGFRGDYNCALEPTNGYYDMVSIAKENGALPILKPNDKMEFNLKINAKREVSK
ncbi:MAG: DUF4432 family protein, partial [Oscillospiraceae bacterium]